MSKSLEIVCYLVLTTTAIVLAWNNLRDRDLAPSPEQSDRAPAFAEGAVLPTFQLLTPPADTVPATGSDEETLLVFFSTSCAYCLASLPTYRRVASTRCDLAMTFVMLDIPISQVDHWWSENAWERAASCAKIRVGTAATSIASFGRIATPTHYLVDGSGRVLISQVGALYDIPSWLAVESPAGTS